MSKVFPKALFLPLVIEGAAFPTHPKKARVLVTVKGSTVAYLLEKRLGEPILVIYLSLARKH